MKLIIAGSRTFNNFTLLCESLVSFESMVTEVVSGTAAGADMMGEYWADAVGIKIMRFPAQWDLLGKSAGYIRNQVMADYSDALIAFHDGRSRGTQHMINLARKNELKVTVIQF